MMVDRGIWKRRRLEGRSRAPGLKPGIAGDHEAEVLELVILWVCRSSRQRGSFGLGNVSCGSSTFSGKCSIEHLAHNSCLK
ncbi:hypothetical protein GOP47_0013257 [Adiantum capillus-veneris]|uniref:Uncharacterized protein n=1 Tax=Adiantum capillus-veneris TaxID=13818 RepID=A0A9D4ZFL7_ADICA|nr:hypothetical protein GOP47_0013257 [Adiantum capillus-veneris]